MISLLILDLRWVLRRGWIKRGILLLLLFSIFSPPPYIYTRILLTNFYTDDGSWDGSEHLFRTVHSKCSVTLFSL